MVFPVSEKIQTAHTELPTSLPMGCTWATECAARWNFAMQIRLLTTSIYENSGELSGQPITSKFKKWAAQWAVHYFQIQKVGSSVGSGVGCP